MFRENNLSTEKIAALQVGQPVVWSKTGSTYQGRVTRLTPAQVVVGYRINGRELETRFRKDNGRMVGDTWTLLLDPDHEQTKRALASTVRQWKQNELYSKSLAWQRDKKNDTLLRELRDLIDTYLGD